MCEWGAIRDERAAEVVEGGGSALCATGVFEVEALVDIARGELNVVGKLKSLLGRSFTSLLTLSRHHPSMAIPDKRSRRFIRCLAVSSL